MYKMCISSIFYDISYVFQYPCPSTHIGPLELYNIYIWVPPSNQGCKPPQRGDMRYICVFCVCSSTPGEVFFLVRWNRI